MGHNPVSVTSESQYSPVDPRCVSSRQIAGSRK